MKDMSIYFNSDKYQGNIVAFEWQSKSSPARIAACRALLHQHAQLYACHGWVLVTHLRKNE